MNSGIGDQRQRKAGSGGFGLSYWIFRMGRFSATFLLTHKWRSAYSESVVSSWSGHKTIYDYSEFFKVLGWEDVGVRAGKFKAFKLGYKLTSFQLEK